MPVVICCHAQQIPRVIDSTLTMKLNKVTILGPFSPETAPLVHINRFGAIPKKNQPGKWRLFTDLSYAVGSSVMTLLMLQCAL